MVSFNVSSLAFSEVAQQCVQADLVVGRAKKQSPSENIFPFRWLALAPSRFLPVLQSASAGAILLAQPLSQNGKVAYLEAECFGGVGGQASAGWQNGELIFQPRLHPVASSPR